jgi:hypothetical protein
MLPIHVHLSLPEAKLPLLKILSAGKSLCLARLGSTRRPALQATEPIASSAHHNGGAARLVAVASSLTGHFSNTTVGTLAPPMDQ